ncbi:MAG: hypothetical protein AB7P04_15270 [Bacteriovoracia bacterium]
MRRVFTASSGFACGLLLLSGCAHTPLKEQGNAQLLFERACEPGRQLKSASGQLWIQASSPEASGKFPASAKAVVPGQLDMEVTNLLGGTEAHIRVRGNVFELNVPKEPERSRRGQDHWGGIPLRWATDLFIGRVPCPPAGAKTKLEADGADGLVAEYEGERFVYRFREYAGKAWPERLEWVDTATGRAVKFEFFNPEPETRSPLQWEAISELGQVKTRWRSRTHQP